MIKKGKGCKIGNVKMIGKGEIVLGDDVTISNDVIINVSERLFIDDRSMIGDHFEIEGRCIEIGKEFWSGRYCGIGGGSCFEKLSSLKIGHQCHLGDFAFINTARAVKIGDEVGLGQFTRVYTHGAYESFLEGFPVEFGPVTLEERVWCPNAIIMPNVTIGHDTVVGAGAVVTESLPSGCLALGVPAKVVNENCFPRKFSKEEKIKMIEQFINHFVSDVQFSKDIKQFGTKVSVSGTLFDLDEMIIDGEANELTEKFKNELRRYGIRFRYYNKDAVYAKW